MHRRRRHATWSQPAKAAALSICPSALSSEVDSARASLADNHARLLRSVAGKASARHGRHMVATAALASIAPHDHAGSLDDALRDLDPLELRSPIVRRVDASGFVTEDILSRAVARLQRYRVNGNSLLVDLGCGAGGISLWLAERSGARLHGVDADPLAIGRARRSTRNFILAHDATFDCASYEATWIEPSLAHAVVSFDALHLASRPVAALAEAHRVLVSGGVVMFNVYVADDDPGALSWVHTLEEAGFAMLDIDDQTHVWRSVMSAKHRARIVHAAHLGKRFGERVIAPELAVSRTMLGLDYGPSVIANTRRVELVARKITSRKRSPSSPDMLRPIDE
jgi:SAM-dependent methyltransferase